MKTSSHIEQSLFYEQSPATDQYFEDRAPQLFQQPGGSSFVKIDVQVPYNECVSEGCIWVQKLESDSKSDDVSNLQPPSPVDWDRFLRKEPPHYVEPARLQRYEVSAPVELAKIAGVCIYYMGFEQ